MVNKKVEKFITDIKNLGIEIQRVYHAQTSPSIYISLAFYHNNSNVFKKKVRISYGIHCIIPGIKKKKADYYIDAKNLSYQKTLKIIKKDFEKIKKKYKKMPPNIKLNEEFAVAHLKLGGL